MPRAPPILSFGSLDHGDDFENPMEIVKSSKLTRPRMDAAFHAWERMI